MIPRYTFPCISVLRGSKELVICGHMSRALCCAIITTKGHGSLFVIAKQLNKFYLKIIQNDQEFVSFVIFEQSCIQ
jgi:hypothetical protein